MSRFLPRSLLREKRLISESRKIGDRSVHLIQIKAPVDSLRQPIRHAVAHARSLAEEARQNNLPVKLFMSGGIDSEAMAEAFLLAEVKFEAVIGRYNGDMNEFDYKDAVSFCEKHGIKTEFIDVDVFKFLESDGALTYGAEFGCRSPQLAVHLHLLDRVSGYCVLAGNPIYPVFESSSEKLARELMNGKAALTDVWGAPNQTQAVFLRFFEKRKRRGQPFFFQSSPELCLSFLNLDEIVSHMANGIKNHTYPMKCQMYKAGGFEAKPRAGKFTGFEKYRLEYDSRMKTSHGTGFDDLFRKPLELLNPALHLTVTFELPEQVTKKLCEKLVSSGQVQSAPSNSSVLQKGRRQMLGQTGVAFGAVLITLFFPRFALATTCTCCHGGNPDEPHAGLMGAAACIKICQGSGADGFSLGGGSCSDFF